MGFFDTLFSLFLPDPPVIGPEENVVFVDVRTPREHARTRVAGSKHIPVGELTTRWTELRNHEDRRILVYCATGSRSKLATRILHSKGFHRAENAGGIGGLRRAGVELE